MKPMGGVWAHVSILMFVVGKRQWEKEYYERFCLHDSLISHSPISFPTPKLCMLAGNQVLFVISVREVCSEHQNGAGDDINKC